jgi:large subunit ribosomal protein L29
MQVREIRNLTVSEIEQRLEESSRELFTLRRAWELGRLEDHNRIRAVKRDIARMKTVLRERELGAVLMEEGEETHEGKA